MKFKHFYPLLAVFAFSGLYAQVGINTPNPQSTLDVVGNGASTSTKDGVTAPRLTRQQLAAKVAGTYATAQSGTLVYVTDAGTPSGTTPSLAQTADITKVGYYYFDGTVWKQISDTDSPSVNIYSSDGTIGGNRIVSQLNRTLAFNGTVANAFSINRSSSANPILSVDAANERVGVGTNSPEAKFHIVSPTSSLGRYSLIDAPQSTLENAILVLRNTSALATANKAYIGFSNAGPTAGGADWQLGSIRTSAAAGGINQDFYIGNATTGTLNERFRIASNGNVGIGVSIPSVKLDINSGGTPTTPVTAIKIVDGNQAVGKILTSDVNGVGTWQTPVVPTSVNLYNTDGTLTGNRVVAQGANTLAFTSTATNGFSVDGTTFSIDAANDRIGIGTTAPVSELQVVGNELRLGGPSTQAGTVDSPILRIHSKSNADGLGGSLLFSENNPGFGYYIKHNTGPGATGGLDGLAIGAIDVNTPARPAIFVSGGQAVGLGTATPQAVFHIDGAKDNNINSAPTVAQIANDIVVNTVGNLGIGSTAPTVKLDINSGGTPTTPITAVKIVDGNQAAGKILTSDASGLATWQTPATAASVNLYNTDGTLSGDRIVSQANRSLAFNTTIVNAFSINRSNSSNPLFSVDAANDRVGIGTSAPAHRLHVVSGAASVNRYNLFDAANSTNQYGIVALRNTSPLATGNYSLLGFTNSGPTSGGGNWAIGSIRTGATVTTGSEEDFVVGNSLGGGLNERMRVTSSGSVGIGTGAPSNTLDVNGTARVRTLAAATTTDSPLYVDGNGVIKKLNNSAPVRQVWGVVRFNTAGNMTIINPGSGDWTVTYVGPGTAIITVNTPFTTVPAVNARQSLGFTSTTTSSTGFVQANIADSSGVDHVSLNQTQIWVSNSTPARADQNRLASFSIVGL